MFVRLCSGQRPCYAMGYGSVSFGGRYHLIALVPESGCFELIPYFDKDTRSTLYETIDADTTDWIRHNGFHHLAPYAFHGYADVLKQILPALLDGSTVPAKDDGVTLRPLPHADAWNYLLTPADADDFLNCFAGFHDAQIEEIRFVQPTNGPSCALLTIDNSCWYGRVEMCFMGVQTMHIVPAQENISNTLWDGTLRVRDCRVFFADNALGEDGAPDECVSWISALCARWRKIT